MNELVNNWMMNEWLNEGVTYLSQKERKIDTGSVEEASDWSQVREPLEIFQDHKNGIKKNPMSVLPKSSLGWWNESCQVWGENQDIPVVQLRLP